MSTGERSRSVLLIRLSALGDCLHAVPVVEEIRRQRPSWRIGWAIERNGFRLLGAHRDVDRFHLYPRRSGARFVPALARLRRELRAERYDIALDVQGLTKSGLVAWLSGAPRRISFAPPDGRELNRLFVNERIAVPREVRHVVDRNLALLCALGLEPPGAATWRLDPPPPREAERVKRFLDGAGLARGSFVILNPGAAWPTKQWPVSHFAALARGLLDEERVAVVVSWGSEEEKRRARQIATEVAHERCFVAPQTALEELIVLIAASRLFVGGDTGPMHLAVALGVPTVALFGPTDPARTGPYGEREIALVLDKSLECRPCHRRRCARGDLACLAELSAERALAACRRRLDDGA